MGIRRAALLGTWRPWPRETDRLFEQYRALNKELRHVESLVDVFEGVGGACEWTDDADTPEVYRRAEGLARVAALNRELLDQDNLDWCVLVELGQSAVRRWRGFFVRWYDLVQIVHFQAFLALAAHGVHLCVIRAIERLVVACFVVVVVIAIVPIGLAELPFALSTPYSPPPLEFRIVLIAASVAFGIAVANKFDVEREIDPLRTPSFWPKSAGSWFAVVVLFGLLVGPLLKLAWTFL